MFQINPIKNPPTLEDLKSLYDNEIYQNLLIEFEKHSHHRLISKIDGDINLTRTLNFIQRLYLILNIPFDEVCSAFEQQSSNLLNYTILCIDFFSKLENESKEEPSEDGEALGVTRTFFLDKFCELYLLKTGDKERLLHYLETTRMPYPKEYMKLISEFYKQIKGL